LTICAVSVCKFDADQLSGHVLAAMEVLRQAGAGPACLLGEVDPRASGVPQRANTVASVAAWTECPIASVIER
jgi:hypothetical protein